MSAGLASGTANLSLADAVAPRSPALWRQALGLNRTRIGLAIVILVGAVAWLGPYAAPYGATEFVDAAYAPPSAAALFGADNLGRDVLSRFLSGGRSVLTLSLIATLLGVAGGTAIGLIAAVSVLGFGLQPPAADWGLMINENRLGLTIQPWAVALPVLAIGLLTVGVNLVADGIARAAIGLDRRREG